MYARTRERSFPVRATRALGAALSALALAAGLAAAAPIAGTPIDNVARGAGVDVPSGVIVSPRSNAVRAVVQPREAIALTPRGPLTLGPGDAATFAHTLRNTGNTTSDFTLTLGNAGGDDFDLDTPALWIDTDRDGALGGGDTPLASGDAVALASGDSLALLVTGTVPITAPGAAAAWLTLSARSQAQGAVETVTDTVLTPAVVVPPTLAFFTGADYLTPTRRTALGARLFVQATAPLADRSPVAADTVVVRLASRLTGDLDDFLAAETGAHTGVFRIVPSAGAAPGRARPAALVGDGVVTMRRGDRVDASLAGWGAPLTQASVWVDPAGVVFDAHTDLPLAAARVRLIDVTGAGNGGRPGELATVRAIDGVTPMSAEVTTGADGRYEFPWLAPSTYRLVVAPPDGFRFPSLAAPGTLGGGHVIDAGGSYGQPFPLTVDGDPVALDLPLDGVAPVVLFAEKTASRAEAEPGDDIGYRVRVANRSDSAVTALVLRDALPPGFGYVAGSARLDGVPAGAPAREGGTLVFALGALAPHATVTLTYRAHVGVGASLGDALNRAVASGGGAVSNEAVARVTVRGGVFADEGVVLGTVGIDADRDGVLEAGEPGLPGVRVVMDDGTYAVTDGRGRFSFVGVTPRTHALKVDPATVPAAATLVSLDHRAGAVPGLRFVDLVRGGIARADFAAVGDTATLREAGERSLARTRSEADRVLARGGDPLTPPTPVADPRTLPASRVLTGEASLGAPRSEGPNGIVGIAPALLADADGGGGGEGAVASAIITGPRAAAPRASAPAPLTTAMMATLPLEQIVTRLDVGLGFVGLADLDTVTTTQVAVRVKGAVHTRLELAVNGEPLPDSRVARRVIAPEAGIEAWEYLGVDLKPGVNVLEVGPPEAAARVAVRLVAPGPLAALALEAPRSVPADGYAVAPLTLTLRDAHGVPVGARTLVTLTTTLGRVRLADLDPRTAGTQVAVEGGALAVPLEAPPSPGVAQVTATAGEWTAAAEVPFTVELRRMLAVGLLEGTIGLDTGTRRGREAGAREARFEAPIEQFRVASGDDRLSAAAHGAFYMKGHVSGPWSLAMGYDSDRERDQRRFRDLQTDQGYAVLGDASVRGYDAQSTGRLYTRLERPGAWMLYGDYVTAGIGGGSEGGRSLAAYNRSFSGAQTHWETPRWRVDAFTSRDRTHSQVDELPGLGISGPYRTSRYPFVENSERVEIVVRDREHPSVVLSASARERFTDYEVEPFTGRLVFRAPVPSLDAALNPVSVRVTYEVRAEDGGPGGEAFWVHGGTVRYRPLARLELSGTAVDDHDPTGARELRGAGLRATLAPRTTLEGEWATTRRWGASAGDAGRLELRHQSAGVEASLWGATAARGFDNPSAGFAGGRDEAGARLVARLAARTRLRAEGSYSAEAGGERSRGGGLLAFERSFTDAWRGELGARWADGASVTAGQDPRVAALRAKLAWQPRGHTAWTAYAEGEQDVRASERRMAALGAEYRVREHGRLYARHELVSSLASGWDLNGAQQRLATVVGADADVRRDQHVFGEYRLADVLAGREAQAAVGLRNGWPVAPGVRLGTTFERVSPLGTGTASSGATTAATVAIDFTGDTGWKGSSRLEVRANRTDTQVLQSMATAVELDPAWTALFRYALSVTRANGAGAGEARARLQAGAAWRPGGAWEALGRYEVRYDRGGSALVSLAASEDAESRGRRIANILSLHADGQLSDGDQVSLAWAGKVAREEAGGAIAAGGAQWLRARATRDLARGWDAGWTVSALTGRSLGQIRYGLGAELGRQLPMGVWLSAGYNHFGYSDDELTGQDWTRAGVYVRARMKLDESSLQRGGGGR